MRWVQVNEISGNRDHRLPRCPSLTSAPPESGRISNGGVRGVSRSEQSIPGWHCNSGACDQKRTLSKNGKVSRLFISGYHGELCNTSCRSAEEPERTTTIAHCLSCCTTSSSSDVLNKHPQVALLPKLSTSATTRSTACEGTGRTQQANGVRRQVNERAVQKTRHYCVSVPIAGTVTFVFRLTPDVGNSHCSLGAPLWSTMALTQSRT
jgi:hypothetical protein